MSDADKAPVTAAIHASRVLILEWLSQGEYLTGTDLAASLTAADPTIDVQVVPCASKAEVIRAIRDAAADVPTRGTPILHIEAHGATQTIVETDENGDDTEVKAAVGFYGPGQTQADRVLYWRELKPELRSLNIATGFNLAFVGAACLSKDLLEDLDRGVPFCFILALTFTNIVGANQLKDSLTAFYLSLLHNRLTMEESLTEANTFLGASVKLAGTSMLRVIRKAVFETVQMVRTGGYDETYLKALAGVEMNAAAEGLEIKVHQRNSTIRAVRRVLGRYLAVDLFPDNLQRFGLDAVDLVDEFWPVHQ
jgi:hypothetical protein